MRHTLTTCGGRQLPVDCLSPWRPWFKVQERPDLTLIFDIPVEMGLGGQIFVEHLDRIESEDMAFFGVCQSDVSAGDSESRYGTRHDFRCDGRY